MTSRCIYCNAHGEMARPGTCQKLPCHPTRLLRPDGYSCLCTALTAGGLVEVHVNALQLQVGVTLLEEEDAVWASVACHKGIYVSDSTVPTKTTHHKPYNMPKECTNAVCDSSNGFCAGGRESTCCWKVTRDRVLAL